MGDREQPQFNRILYKKWEVKQHEIHQRKLGECKAMIDNTQPPEFAHLNDRSKKKQKWMGLSYYTPSLIFFMTLILHHTHMFIYICTCSHYVYYCPFSSCIVILLLL